MQTVEACRMQTTTKVWRKSHSNARSYSHKLKNLKAEKNKKTNNNKGRDVGHSSSDVANF